MARALEKVMHYSDDATVRAINEAMERREYEQLDRERAAGAKGRAKGRMEGRVEGRAEGRAEGRVGRPSRGSSGRLSGRSSGRPSRGSSGRHN